MSTSPERPEPTVASVTVDDLTRDWKAARAALKRYVDASKIDHDYCFKFKQHDDALLAKLKRQGRSKVTALDLYDIVRYTSAQVSGSAIYLDVRPLGPGADEADAVNLEDLARVAKAQLEAEVGDPDKGYPSVRRRVARMASGARAGACKLDLVPGGTHDCEVVPSVVNPGDLSWPPEYLHFNDYGCPRLYETVRMSLQEIRAKGEGKNGWKNTDLVKADDGERQIECDPSVDRDEWEKHSAKATIIIAWLKDDTEQVEVEQEKPLPASRWYMACSTCGYNERDLRDAEEYDGSALPESAPCPQCGMTPDGTPAGYMERIETEPKLGRMPAYNEGHRKIIFAPCSPEADFLRDGPWPKGLTNFPHGMYVPDPFPTEPWGNSQTSEFMDLQALKNAALRSGAEQMERNRDLLIVKEDALWDANHEPYQHDGSGDFVAFTGDYDSLQGIKHFQGSGLNVAFTSWMGQLNQELSAHRGIGQLALSPAQLKGTTAETAARQQESGDVPVDERIRILREFEEQLFTRWLELMVGNYDLERWVEVSGASGETAWRVFKGTRMPHLKVRVHAGPNLNAVDLDKALKLRGLAGQSPALIRFVGRAANIDSGLIDQFIKESTQPSASAGGGMMPPRAMEPMAMVQ